MLQKFCNVTKQFPLTMRFIGLLLVPIVIVSFFVYARLQDGLPADRIMLSAAGLSGPVSVHRDVHGVPHIQASTDSDAFFAIGYVQAQDRLWQLELQRRMIHGQLSEAFGKNSVPQDVWFRTLALPTAAKSAWEALSSEAKLSLTAYTNGLNAGIAAQRNLPVEFSLMGIAPQRWTECDSLAWIKVFALNLGGNFKKEMARFAAGQSLTPEQLGTFFPAYPGNMPTTIMPAARNIGKESEWSKLLIFQQQLETGLQLGGQSVGSNAWVVSGRHTGNGAALLANDPHLGLQIPSLWYVVVAKGATLDVSGMTLVGLPFVIFGHNQRIGWGGTNMMADSQDLYFEHPSPTDPALYEAGREWKKFTSRIETINVRADFPEILHNKYRPLTVNVRSTRHGPIISDQFNLFDQPVALSWTALDPGDTTYEGFYHLQYATDWWGFNQALRFHVAPALNMVFADRAGNIGYLGAGKIPVRKTGDGAVPSPGWDDKFAWVGFIPFENLPREFNPKSGFIVTANNKVIGDDYPYFISRDWASPARARRIQQLLEDQLKDGRAIGLNDMKKIQADTVDLEAADLVAELLQRFHAGSDQDSAIEYLRNWNGDMARDSRAAAIFNVWMRHFRKRLFDSRLQGYWNKPGQAEYLHSLEQGVSLETLRNILAQGNTSWCSNQKTRLGTCNEILQSSLTSALAEIYKISGERSLDKLRWGQLQKTVYNHVPFSQIKPLDFFFERRIDNGGSENSINVATSNFVEKKGYEQRVGADFRQVMELASENVLLDYMNSTGQSGNLISSHYADMISEFRNVQYFRLTSTAEAAGEPGATGVIRFQKHSGANK